MKQKNMNDKMVSKCKKCHPNPKSILVFQRFMNKYFILFFIARAVAYQESHDIQLELLLVLLCS